VVWLRGRWKTVCARVARPAWSRGPSTSPLGAMGKSLLTTVLCVLGAVTWPLPIAACNGPPRPSVEKLFASADVVVLAVATSIQQTPLAKGFVTEEVRFTVLESWKGDKHPDDVIVTRSTIGPGSCGLSALNDPPWLEDPRGKVRKLSGVWVLYFSKGQGPQELGMFGGSLPLDAGGVGDLPDLYRRSHRAYAK